MNQITPQQALNNLTQLAEAHLLSGPDRRIINESLAALGALIAANAKPEEPAKAP